MNSKISIKLSENKPKNKKKWRNEKSIYDSLNQFKLKDEVIRKKFGGGGKAVKEEIVVSTWSHNQAKYSKFGSSGAWRNIWHWRIPSIFNASLSRICKSACISIWLGVSASFTASYCFEWSTLACEIYKCSCSSFEYRSFRSSMIMLVLLGVVLLELVSIFKLFNLIMIILIFKLSSIKSVETTRRYCL